ncbi:MAG: T9SS type A sorting domain-containing protein [Bacteroidetes bacterium]|nr:T9SS type A sorting domain-containing protein [Bacteroidota bacterium]
MMKIKILLFCFLLPTISSAQISAEYQYNFTFSDELNNSQVLILGKDPFGTDGIDTLFGEEFIPQVPPGEFGVRFQLPPDTSITTIKDIRFGCYWATGHEHLIDLIYQTGSSSISVVWEWDSLLIFGLYDIRFINPYTGQTIASYSWFSDSSHFIIPPSLDKIKIWTLYNGTLSWEEYEVLAPNGGETLEAGEIYNVNWWDNELGLNMDIELSSDSGATWSYIVKDLWIYQINSYEWQVPFINSENCLIRIGDFPCKYDISDSVFTITYPVSTETEERLPTEFSLEQNYPNPFNPSTSIQYEVSKRQFVTLKVYDVLGKEIVTLVNEEKPAGNYEFEFDGSALTSGIYFYQLKTDTYIETRKMVLLK